jgi:hypothetical protein
MPKISDEEMEVKAVHLFKSDLDYLRSLYNGSFGVNKAIRSIVRSWVNVAKASASARIDEVESKDHSELV